MADAAIHFADRMKRTVAEENLLRIWAEWTDFLGSLAVEWRSIDGELDLIASIRRHLGMHFGTTSQAKTERSGIHATDDPLSPRSVLERATAHNSDHLRIMQRKEQILLFLVS